MRFVIPVLAVVGILAGAGCNGKAVEDLAACNTELTQVKSDLTAATAAKASLEQRAIAAENRVKELQAATDAGTNPAATEPAAADAGAKAQPGVKPAPAARPAAPAPHAVAPKPAAPAAKPAAAAPDVPKTPEQQKKEAIKKKAFNF